MTYLFIGLYLFFFLLVVLFLKGAERPKPIRGEMRHKLSEFEDEDQ